MDDNTLKLIEKVISLQSELSELRALRTTLVNLLWDAELGYAKEYQQYKTYNKDIRNATVKTSDVRNIFGIMPNPEAVAIYKNVKEEAENDED